jgi:hypothetical protein
LRVALPPEVRHAAAGEIGRFCASRSGEDYRLEHSIRGDAITIVERRPPWQPGPDAEWSTLDVAQLRHDGRFWMLYWRRASGRWERYAGMGTTADVARLLAEIDADPDGVFWG